MGVNNDVCDVEALEQFNHPKWTSWDVVRWKLGDWAGGQAHLHDYKDSYIRFHRDRIKAAANRNQIPAVLLASVAWAEAGGKPDAAKSVVFNIRRFDWSGPDWVDRNLTITHPPEKTSFGIIAMQIGVAERELDPSSSGSPSMLRQGILRQCLMMDAFNIEIVASHLRNLILHDYPNSGTLNLTEGQIILAGSRYNRGKERDKQHFLDSISAPPADQVADPEGYKLRDYTSYGRALIRRLPHVRELLK